MLKKKIVVFGALPDSLINFRGSLLNEFSKVSEVHAIATKCNIVRDKLSAASISYSAAPVDRASLNPIQDFGLLLWLIREWFRLKPSKILAYTIKPVIWGGIAARFFPKIEFYALITGLGYAFEGGSIKRRVLRRVVIALYKLALGNARAVVFQNRDNMELFIKWGVCSSEKVRVVDGSGVDLDHFSFSSLGTPDNVTFLMVARILNAKGVGEYIEAAEQVKQRYPQTNFVFVGPEDPSPDGLKKSIFDETSAVSYLGEQGDVRPSIIKSSVFVLPSFYNEGLPRSIQEALSIGRPIITTDHVGCRETVVEGSNGFLVPVRDAQQLSAKMIWCIEHKEELVGMGRKSRDLAEGRFDVRKINADILEIMGLSS